jgi:hypothetical protein
MTIASETISKIKLSLRNTSDAFDTELVDLVEAALLDLHIAGVNGVNVVVTDPLVLRAITTYCKMYFGEPDEFERLKASYDEQKAQMSMATGYTTWRA